MFAPVITAPSSAISISSPDYLPESLQTRSIIWYGGVLKMNNSSGDVGVRFPENTLTDVKLSYDDRNIVYVAHTLIMEEGLPKPGDYEIKIMAIQSGNSRLLVSKENLFPDAVLFAEPTFSHDGQYVVFLAAWEKDMDLISINIENGQLRRLNANVLLTNFGQPDVSSQGQIVVICKGQEPNSVSELCLLDKNGKFVRYITSEGYPWPGYGLFTPDGKQVVYESRYKLYKVSSDGKDRTQLAPCGTPLLVTDDYVVVQCYLSQEPACFGLFIVGLDGVDFRRIGYVKEVCSD